MSFRYRFWIETFSDLSASVSSPMSDCVILGPGCRLIKSELVLADPDLVTTHHPWIRKMSPWPRKRLNCNSISVQEENALLPAMQHWPHIVDAARGNEIVLMDVSPGCGKSTKVPQLIAETFDFVFIWRA